MRFIPLIFLLGGCAGIHPVAYPYPKLGITLVCADEDSIDRTCRPVGNPTIGDHGQTIPKWYDWTDSKGLLHFEQLKIPACFKLPEREIWMRWGDWCDTMAHELCHAEGLEAAYCEDYYPKR